MAGSSNPGVRQIHRVLEPKGCQPCRQTSQKKDFQEAAAPQHIFFSGAIWRIFVNLRGSMLLSAAPGQPCSAGIQGAGLVMAFIAAVPAMADRNGIFVSDLDWFSRHEKGQGRRSGFQHQTGERPGLPAKGAADRAHGGVACFGNLSMCCFRRLRGFLSLAVL